MRLEIQKLPAINNDKKVTDMLFTCMSKRERARVGRAVPEYGTHMLGRDRKGRLYSGGGTMLSWRVEENG